MTRSASTRRRIILASSIVPAPQERPPVAMTLVLVGFAVAFGVWWWL